MKKFAFHLQTLNSPPVLLRVLQAVQGTGIMVEDFVAGVMPFNDKYGRITIRVEAETEKIPVVKVLLESLQEVIGVEVKDGEPVTYYKSYGTV